MLMIHPHYLLFQGEVPEVQEEHLLYVLEGLLPTVLEFLTCLTTLYIENFICVKHTKYIANLNMYIYPVIAIVNVFIIPIDILYCCCGSSLLFVNKGQSVWELVKYVSDRGMYSCSDMCLWI